MKGLLLSWDILADPQAARQIPLAVLTPDAQPLLSSTNSKPDGLTTAAGAAGATVDLLNITGSASGSSSLIDHAAGADAVNVSSSKSNNSSSSSNAVAAACRRAAPELAALTAEPIKVRRHRLVPSDISKCLKSKQRSSFVVLSARNNGATVVTFSTLIA